MSRDQEEAWLLVDGNNIIHAWPDLLELHRKRRGLAHTELCRRLRLFGDDSDLRIAVIFDGKGNRIEEERESSGLQIIYTDSGSTADDVIERLARRYSGKNRILVATDDFAEQNMVSSFGAETMSSGALKDAIDRSEGSWRKRLE